LEFGEAVQGGKIMRHARFSSFYLRLVTYTLFALVVVQRYDVTAADKYITSGEQANALLCRPEGKGPFAAVIWSHGKVEKEKKSGWQRMCEALASEGVLAFIPVREVERGTHPRDIFYNQAELSRAVDYVKGLPDVDPSRVALMGHSRGGLLTLMVGLERKDLKALIITAPADVRPYFLGSVARVSRLNVPVLLLVEKGDEMGSLGAVDILDQALRNDRKEVRTIRYDRGGGHYLFVRVDYWWDDLRAFLREKLL
jgi:dienelactone hydrolase